MKKPVESELIYEEVGVDTYDQDADASDHTEVTKYQDADASAHPEVPEYKITESR